MIFRTISRNNTIPRPGGNVIVWLRGCSLAVAVNSTHACGPEPLFGSCDCCALPARTIYRVGGLRGRAHAIAPGSSLVAYRFPDPGNSHGVAALALSFDAPRKLAGRKGRHRTISEWFPAPLSGYAGLPEHFCNRAHRGWSGSLCLQSFALWYASLAYPTWITEAERPLPSL